MQNPNANKDPSKLFPLILDCTSWSFLNCKNSDAIAYNPLVCKYKKVHCLLTLFVILKKCNHITKASVSLMLH